MTFSPGKLALGGEENPFSMSLGDLMAGLLLIFVLLLAFAMLRLEGMIAQRQDQIEAMDEREFAKKRLIANLLEQLAAYDVEIDPQTGTIRIKEGILFDYDDAKLKPAGKAFLRRFIPRYAAILFSDPAVRDQIAQVIVEGHTDNRGSYSYNLELSLQRARSVAAYLFAPEFGTFPHQRELQRLLSANGRSFMEPRASNATAAGRAQNRRVEIKFRLKDWDMVRSAEATAGERAGAP